MKHVIPSTPLATAFIVGLAVMVVGGIAADNYLGIVGYWVNTIWFLAAVVFSVTMLILLFRAKFGPADSEGNEDDRAVTQAEDGGTTDVGGMFTIKKTSWGLFAVFVAIIVGIGIFGGYQTYIHLLDLPYLDNPEVVHMESVLGDISSGEYKDSYYLYCYESDRTVRFSVPASTYEEWDRLFQEMADAQGDKDASQWDQRVDADISYLPHSEQVLDVHLEVVPDTDNT